MCEYQSDLLSWHDAPVSIEQDVASPETPNKRAVAAMSDADDRTLDGVRILLVEDEDDARELLTRVFERAGAVVTGAGSVDGAWEQLDVVSETGGAPVDLLVSDIGLPVDDGYLLIERLRERKDALGDLPAIALTAYIRGVDRARALRSGFDAHTPKPVDPEHLVALAARVLAQNPRRTF
jgi:CheY-like chemotaxis protein